MNIHLTNWPINGQNTNYIAWPSTSESDTEELFSISNDKQEDVAKWVKDNNPRRLKKEETYHFMYSSDDKDKFLEEYILTSKQSVVFLLRYK